MKAIFLELIGADRTKIAEFCLKLPKLTLLYLRFVHFIYTIKLIVLILISGTVHTTETFLHFSIK